MAEINVTKDLENKKLVLEYTINGPLEKVWRAYTDKDWFEKWWGPEGWETTAKEFSFQPGGRLHYGMKCVDENQGEWFGKTSWGIMEIQDVEAMKRFSYKDHFSNEEGTFDATLPVLSVTTEFFDKGDKTKIISTSNADSAEQIEQVLQMGMLEGYSSQLNKLNEMVK